MNRQQLEIDNYEDNNYQNEEDIDQDDEQDDVDYEAQFHTNQNRQALSDNYQSSGRDYQRSIQEEASLDTQGQPKRSKDKPSSIKHTTNKLPLQQVQVRKGSHKNLIQGPQKNATRQAMTSLDQESYPQQVLHQFNQPQIVNYTQNAYFGSPYSQPVSFLPTQQHINLPHWKPKMFGGSPQQNNKKKRPTSAIHNSTMRIKEEEKHQNYFAYNAASGKQKSSVLTDFQNTNYRKKIIPSSQFYDREDLYDQNLLVKLKNNEYLDENTQLKTKLQIMQNQMKEKDKLIDEIYKSAYITANGQQANKNLNKDLLMLVKLKRRVQELKDILSNKESELVELRKQMRNTKINELQIENKALLHECFRLRNITENSIRLSGELDVEKMRKDRQLEIQNYNNHLQQFELQKNMLDQEIQKLKSDVNDEKEEANEWRDKYEASQKKVSQLMKDIETLIQNNSMMVDKKDKEIKRLKENLTDARVQISNLQQEIDKLRQNLEETRKKIPLRPEAEYIEEIEQKNEKIEELMDELLKKDTLIDQQAVMNKNMQKKVDSLTSQLKELSENKEELKSQVELENQQNKDLQNVIEAMKMKLKEIELNKEEEVQHLTQTYEQKLQKMNSQIEESIKQKMELEQKIVILSYVDLVKKDNPIIVEVIEKVKRTCQVNKITNDEVEKLVFDHDYRPEKKVSIQELQSLLIQKLHLSQEESLLFARYLIEPSDQERLEFSEKRQASSSTIVVRIMNQIRDLRIYSEEDYNKALKEIGSELVREDSLYQLEDILNHYGNTLTIKEIEAVMRALKLNLDKTTLEVCFVNLLRQSNSIDKIQTVLLVEMVKEAEDIERNFFFSRQQESAQKQNDDQEENIGYNQDLSNQKFNIKEEEDVQMNINEHAKEEIVEPVPQLDAKTIISNKLEANSGQEQIPDSLFDEIVQQTEDVFDQMAENLKQKQKTARELFKGKIYTIPHPDTLQEVEAIKFDDLLKKLEKFAQCKVNTQQEQMMTLVLQKSRLLKYHLVMFDDINEILRSFGVPENLPPSRRGLQYEYPDLKSKRILNRLVSYLKDKEISITEFIQDISQIKTIRYNNSQSKKVEIIKCENFFKKLHTHGIIKHLRIHENLAMFLAIRPDFSQFLLQKKVKKVIKVFAQSKAFQQVGKKKLKFKELDKYYDQLKKQTENLGKIVEYSSIQQDVTSKDMDTSKKVQRQQSGSRIINQHSDFKDNARREEEKVPEKNLLEPDEDIDTVPNMGKKKDDEEYEYYDEEDDEKEKKKDSDYEEF